MCSFDVTGSEKTLLVTLYSFPKKVKTKQPLNVDRIRGLPLFYLKMLDFLKKHVAEILGEEGYTEHLMTNLLSTKVFQ